MSEKIAEKTSLEIKRFVNAPPGPRNLRRVVFSIDSNNFYCRAFCETTGRLTQTLYNNC